MKLYILVLSVMTLISISFSSCTTLELTELIDPNDAKVIGSWKHIHSKQWSSDQGFDFIGEFTSTPNEIVEIKKGDFTLVDDQLIYQDQIYTVKFLADTIWMLKPNQEHRYERVR